MHQFTCICHVNYICIALNPGWSQRASQATLGYIPVNTLPKRASKKHNYHRQALHLDLLKRMVVNKWIFVRFIFLLIKGDWSEVQ